MICQFVTVSSASSAKRRCVILAALASCSLGLTACSSGSPSSGGTEAGTSGSSGAASTGSMAGGSGAAPAGSGTSSGLASAGSGSGGSGGLSSGSADLDASAPDGTTAPSTEAGALDAATDGGSVVDEGGPVVGDGGPETYPLLKVLPLFTAANVPARGPMESPPSLRRWTPPATLPTRTGNGIAQHPMLYVGENYDRITLVNGGKVVWTYDTAPGYELDDVWMLSNGNILYSHMTFVEEITPQKQVVWHYVPMNGEVHSVQPIGLDKVLFFENSLPMGKVRLYNKKTSTFEVDHMVPIGPAALGRHGEVRRIRMTRAGTYLIGLMDAGQVVEYDSAFNMVWTYVTRRPWSVVRLKNGNTLIQDESLGSTLEVNPQSQIVWQLAKTDFMLPAGAGMANTQSCERLSNGNTVMFGNGTNVNNIQAVEVTPAKKVVWMLQDWVDLGDATSAQFLDEPGYPEVPGDTNH